MTEIVLTIFVLLLVSYAKVWLLLVAVLSAVVIVIKLRDCVTDIEENGDVE
jgi:hypothetical protein